MMMRALMAAALVAGLLPAGVGAQDARERELRTEARTECRCVDADGNEIENCRCLRVPRAPRAPLAAAFGLAGERRARIGVWIDGSQDASVGGVRLQDVQEDGPAWDAGLRAGDVVTRVDGRSVLDPLPGGAEEERLDRNGALPVQRFRRLVADLEPGEPVEVDVLRDGETRSFTVTPESGGIRVMGARAPRLFIDGSEVRVDREEMERLQREMEEMAREMRLRSEEFEMDEEELREFEREMREHAEEFRALERGMAPRAFGLRGPGEAGAWRFQVAPRGEGRSAFSFFGGDPCVRLLERSGEGAEVVRLLGDGCLDGVEFVDLNPELASYFDAPDSGVLVTDVAEEATLGLRAGDVLLALDGREVTGADQARRILRSYDEDEEVRLRVIREGREMEVLGRRRGG